MSYFYMSFVGDTGFLGGCYVRVPADAEALPQREMLWHTLLESHRLGVNPGGEVKTIGPIDDAMMDAAVPTGDRGRLLTRAELEANDERLGTA